MPMLDASDIAPAAELVVLKVPHPGSPPEFLSQPGPTNELPEPVPPGGALLTKNLKTCCSAWDGVVAAPSTMRDAQPISALRSVVFMPKFPRKSKYAMYGFLSRLGRNANRPGGEIAKLFPARQA